MSAEKKEPSVGKKKAPWQHLVGTLAALLGFIMLPRCCLNAVKWLALGAKMYAWERYSSVYLFVVYIDTAFLL